MEWIVMNMTLVQNPECYFCNLLSGIGILLIKFSPTFKKAKFIETATKSSKPKHCMAAIFVVILFLQWVQTKDKLSLEAVIIRNMVVNFNHGWNICPPGKFKDEWDYTILQRSFSVDQMYPASGMMNVATPLKIKINMLMVYYLLITAVASRICTWITLAKPM